MLLTVAIIVLVIILVKCGVKKTAAKAGEVTAKVMNKASKAPEAVGKAAGGFMNTLEDGVKSFREAYKDARK
jgi:hypothetical protein